MKRGMSPIVAVVLLIAISTIAAISIYFWSAGLVTKQPGPEKPVPIVANPIGGGKVLIANLGQEPVNASSLKTSDPNVEVSCSSATIQPGEQVLCTITGTPSSGTIAIYGGGTGSTTLTITNETIDNPPTINWVVDNTTNSRVLLGYTIQIKANVTDDIGVDTVLEKDNSSGSWTSNTMNSAGQDVYVKDITPTIAGLLQYYVWANDTSGQSVQSATKSIQVIQNWFYTYGGGYINQVLKLSDGYLLVGHANYNGMAIYLYENGTVKWAKEYDTGGNDYVYTAVPITSGFLLGGTTGTDALLIGINTDGTLKTDSNQTFDFGGTDIIMSLTEASDGSIVFVGITNNSAGIGKLVPLRTVPSWSIDWALVYNETDSGFSYAYPTSDGNILAVGHSGTNLLVAKVSTTGSVIWTKEYYHTNVPANHNYDLQATSATEYGGNYYIGGYIEDDDLALAVTTLIDPYVIQMDTTGTVLGSISFQSTSATGGVNKISDGLVFWVRNGNATMMKLDSGLNVQWTKTYYTGSSGILSVVGTDDGGILAGGLAGGNVSAIKTDENGNLASCSVQEITPTTSTVPLAETTPGSFSAVNATVSGVNITVTDRTTPPTCICAPFGCP